MIAIKRLDHVQICIPPGKENEARQFYGVILGLPEIAKPVALAANQGLWYAAGDIDLHIGIEALFCQSKRHPAFEVNDLEAARCQLEKHSITIKKEIQIPGQVRFSFYDPFNNRIEFLEKTTAIPPFIE